MAETKNSEAFDDIVQWAYNTLPKEIKDLPDFPGIQIAEEPPEGYMKSKRLTGELLGMYVGVPRTDRQFNRVQYTPDLIFVFRGPILRRSRGNLREEVKRVVWHEVAHWLGHPERDMRDLGL